jgi:hypothetical protein
VVHAADAPRPISTGKLRHLQETAVTKQHRMKTCNKKEETQKNVHTYNAVTSCTTNMFHDHVGHVYAQRNKCSRRVKQCHVITRKVEALITSIIGQTSEITVEQQSNSAHAVAATRAATSGSNVINL